MGDAPWNSTTKSSPAAAVIQNTKCKGDGASAPLSWR